MIVQEKEYLAHVGVLGMKWGHHKRVESTQVIKARLNVDKTKHGLKVAKKKMLKQTKYGLLIPSKKSKDNLNKAKKDHSYSKTDLKGVKILDKLKTKEKTKAQLSMEEKYKRKGMSNDEAAVAAYQHIRTKKILIGVGTTALVLGSAYAGYKIHDARVDKIIKSGTLLQNISTDSSSGIRDAFYSSNNKLDKIKYRGLFGDAISSKDKPAIQKQVKALRDIKQASRSNAKKTLQELIKNDPDFSSGLKQYMKDNNFNVSKAALNQSININKGISKGMVNTNLYDAFNTALADHSAPMQKLTDTYFNALSKKGYNAIRDVHDVKFTGYNAMNPIIAFNTKGIVDVVDIKALTNAEINKAGKIAYNSLIGSKIIKEGSTIAATVLGAKSISSEIKKNTDSKKIKKYRDENSKSKLTNTEIIRMLERGK